MHTNTCLDSGISCVVALFKRNCMQLLSPTLQRLHVLPDKRNHKTHSLSTGNALIARQRTTSFGGFSATFRKSLHLKRFFALLLACLNPNGNNFLKWIKCTFLCRKRFPRPLAPAVRLQGWFNLAVRRSSFHHPHYVAYLQIVPDLRTVAMIY